MNLTRVSRSAATLTEAAPQKEAALSIVGPKTGAALECISAFEPSTHSL